MIGRPILRPRLWPHRVFKPKSEAKPAGMPIRSRTLIAQAACLGLLGAWLELGVILGHRAWIGTVTNVSVWFSRYHVAMGIAAHLAISLASPVLAIALASRWFRPSTRELAVARFGLFLTLVSPLLAIEELHWAGALAMAAGASYRIGPRWLRGRRPLLRWGLPMLAFASSIVAVLSAVTVATSERRALAGLPPARPNSPNVVLVVLDTVRADHLSLHGYGRETTPHLKSLAGRGIVFDFARASAPWTLPSHASMFTGRWPHELSTDIDRPLDGTHPTLAEHLSASGYATGGFVANAFYCNRWFEVDRGFARYEDAYENEEITPQQTLRCAALTRMLMPVAVWAGLWPNTGQYARHKAAEEVNRDALAWVDERAGRPFFLFLNYLDAHGPYILPDEFPRMFSHATRGELMAANHHARFADHQVHDGPDGRKAALEEFARTGLDAYDDCIRYLDLQIARLVAEIERRGLASNTWIIVTADHGEQFGEHGKYWHGNSLYRPLVDVPLLIVPPTGARAVRVADPVSLRDLPATVVDIIGGSGASPFPGRSLRGLWDSRDEARSVREDHAPLSEFKLPSEAKTLSALKPSERFHSAIVADGQIYHRRPDGAEELYDQDDRHESADLADDPESAATLEGLRLRADRLRRRP